MGFTKSEGNGVEEEPFLYWRSQVRPWVGVMASAIRRTPRALPGRGVRRQLIILVLRESPTVAQLPGHMLIWLHGVTPAREIFLPL